MLSLTTAEPGSCDRGHMAHKAPNIYNLTLPRKRSLRLSLRYQNYSHKKIFPYHPQRREQSSGLLLITDSLSFITLYWCQRRERSLAKEVLDSEQTISLWMLYHRKGSGSSRKRDLNTHLSGGKVTFQGPFKKQVNSAKKIKFI